MKHILTLAVATAALITNTANAQLGVQKVTDKILPKVTLGVKVGMNMQKMNANTTWKESYKPGIVGGAFLSVDKKKIGVRVEGLIKTARFDLAAPIGTSTYVHTVALDIPALFEYLPIKRLRIQVGPQFTTLISAKHSNGVDAKGNFRNSDVSAVGGIEIALPLNLTVGARYIAGLVNMSSTSAASTWKNTSMQFSVGYRLLD